MPALNPLSTLLAAVHDAYLQQREAGAVKRLRACRARMPDQPRPRKARRLQVDAPVPLTVPMPAPITAPVAAPDAVSPAPTFQPAVRPAYPGIAKTGYSTLIGMLEAIDSAAADASQDGARMVEFKIGRTTFKVRQTFKNLAKFKKQVIRYRTSFSDKAIA